MLKLIFILLSIAALIIYIVKNIYKIVNDFYQRHDIGIKRTVITSIIVVIITWVINIFIYRIIFDNNILYNIVSNGAITATCIYTSYFLTIKSKQNFNNNNSNNQTLKSELMSENKK